MPLQGTMAWMVAEDLPIYAYSLMVSTVEQGREVAQLIGRHQACHLKNHGIVVVGRSL